MFQKKYVENGDGVIPKRIEERRRRPSAYTRQSMLLKLNRSSPSPENNFSGGVPKRSKKP
jgi:hypothetical protein